MNSLYRQYGPGRQVPVQNPSPMTNYQAVQQVNPFLQNVMNRVQQMIPSIQNQQQFVLQNFGNIPPEIQNDPDQILQYFQQNQNMLNPLQRQALNALYRR